jgi:hypothetical protein
MSDLDDLASAGRSNRGRTLPPAPQSSGLWIAVAVCIAGIVGAALWAITQSPESPAGQQMTVFEAPARSATGPSSEPSTTPTDDATRPRPATVARTPSRPVLQDIADPFQALEI